MNIGIDIGTSRCKIATVTNDGGLVYSHSVQTAPEHLEAGATLVPLVRDVLSPMLEAALLGNERPSVTVSAVAPALVAFYDNRDPQLVFSHLTPTRIHYAQGESLESRLLFRRQRTEDRLASASSVLLESPKFVLPLASAAALMIGGSVMFDPINSYELGFRSLEDLRDFCCLKGNITSQAACSHVDKLEHAHWAVTTDTCASMIGAGLRNVSDGMVYYGTYHCALELNIPILNCIRVPTLLDVPYYWHVSLPQYGRFLENFLTRILGRGDVTEAFERLDTALLRYNWATHNDAKIRLHPILPDIVTSDTDFRASLENLTPASGNLELEFALATLLGRSLREARERGALQRVKHWFAAGGGAQARSLVQVTSRLSGFDQALRVGAGTARGAAMISAMKHTGRQEVVDITAVDHITAVWD